ncbi:hypothetical protein BN946_scf185008.g103 [Trametes cinnabarina]|uniref:Uncharacterized protein n=1 Tax=Pycnoporus cinnabarinus TaxID=5643 RepID=A0A060SG59_PYCCI|nr:hypothetical protein BN946_scf185008.g103 [Trametes cinnabarina]
MHSLNRWQGLVSCDCETYGCGNTLNGSRPQTAQTRARHLRADKLHKASEAEAAHTQTICANTLPPPTGAAQNESAALLLPEDGHTTSAAVAGYSEPVQSDSSVAVDLEGQSSRERLPRRHSATADDGLPDRFLPADCFADDDDNEGDDNEANGSHDENLAAPTLNGSAPPVLGPALPQADPAERDPLPAHTDLTGLLDEDSRSLTPRAYLELPGIRLLYLQTVLQNLFKNETVDDAAAQLAYGYDIIQATTGQPLPLYPRPARTLKTARRRLGIDIDEYIEKHPICTVCFKFYSHADISALPTPSCTVRRCKGIVWGIKRKASGAEKRVPRKIQAYASFLKSLSRLLLRPEFVNNLHYPCAIKDRAPPQDSDQMHDFRDGAAYGKLELGLKRIRLPDGSVSDVRTHDGGTAITLKMVRRGLSLTVFIDWFGLAQGRPHSAGAVYVAFNNLNRSVRFLTRNVHLLMNIAGPKEPSLEQMNHVLEPFVQEVEILQRGILMNMYGQSRPVEMFGGIEARVFDVQGARKCEGAASHAHNVHMCNFCHATHDEINLPAGYNVEEFRMCDDYAQLAFAWRSREAVLKAARQRILDEGGSHWTEFMALPGWMPVSHAALDYMHNFYLGITKNLFMDFLADGYLLNKKMWDLFDDVLGTIKWPSGIGRLPTNLGENHSLPKADQWRRWLNIQCTMLWLCWRDDSDHIPRTAPPIPANTKQDPGFIRNLREIYEVFIYASVAERFLARENISMDDVHCGHHYLRRCCQEMLCLGVHLVPNHHLAMHYPEIFRLFGPVYAWWLYAQERYNGEQEKVKHNGKSGGEMELTLLRNWVGKHQFYELLTSLPESALPQECALIDRIASLSGVVRGTLLNQLAVFAFTSTISKPKSIRRFTNLRKLRPYVYDLLLTFARKTWPGQTIADDLNCDPSAVTSSAESSARRLLFIAKGGARYGSVADTRTDRDRIACVDFDNSRIPCRILYHFELVLGKLEPVICSVVERLEADDRIPTFPWSMYSTELGVYVAYADRYQPPEVILSSCLACEVAVIPFVSKVLGAAHPLWAIHSFDRTGIEPVDEWFNSLSDELDADIPDET